MENRSSPSSWHSLDLETEKHDVATPPPHTGPSKRPWERAEHREGKVARAHLLIAVIRAHDQCSQSSFHPKSQKELLPRKHISVLPHNLKPPDLSLLFLEIEMKFRSRVWYLRRKKKNGFRVSTTVTFSSLYPNTWTAARGVRPFRWHTSVTPRKTIALLEPRVEASALAALTPSFPEPAKSQLDEPNSMISQVWIWSQAALVPPSELTETILSASF